MILQQDVAPIWQPQRIGGPPFPDRATADESQPVSICDTLILGALRGYDAASKTNRLSRGEHMATAGVQNDLNRCQTSRCI